MMTDANETLRGELERSFELPDMMKLSTELLGYEPEEVGGTTGKGAFARALVERCAGEDALEALADAMAISAPSMAPRLRSTLDGRAGAPLQPGQEVGGFRITERLGEGSVGVVYRADSEDPEVPGPVALKVVRASFARDRAAVRRFLTVQRALRGFEGPGVAPVLGLGQLPDGRPWVARPYYAGPTLAARITRSGGIPLSQARFLLTPVLEALEGLHARGLVHGDLKTQNVFVSEQETAAGIGAHLTDTGVDRLWTRAEPQPGPEGLVPPFGTPKAVAPEVVRGGPPSPASEVYAAGVLIYETVAGRPPFDGDSAIGVAARHLDTEPEPPSRRAPQGRIPEGLDAVVLKALAKDPQARFAGIRALREAFQVIEDAPAAAPATAELDEDAFHQAAEALRERPDDEERVTALERVAARGNAWTRAVDVLLDVADGADDDETRMALLYRVARIQEGELRDTEAAEQTFRMILEIDPEQEIAQVGIEELKRTGGDRDALVELLLEKAERAASAEERAGILREIGQIYEELEQSDNAFVAWVQALADAPRDGRLAEEVERLAGESAERWSEALGTLNEAAQSYDDSGDAAHLYALMGRWYAEHLQRPDFALPCFTHALHLDPSHVPAYDGMIDVYRDAGQWPELVQALDQRAAATTNPTQRRDIHAEAARVRVESLGEVARGIELLEQVLEEDPAHPTAVTALERVYTQRQDWNALAALLEGRSHGETGAERVETLVEVASVYEDRLDDMEKAAVYYEAALEHQPHRLDALKGLERVYARMEKYRELLDNLRRQLHVVSTPRQRIGLLESIGGVLEEEFVDYPQAIEAFEEVTELDPGHDAANRALARLYRHLQRFDDVIETLDRHARSVEDEGQKTELLMQAARVLMADMGAPERALQYCDRVLALDPRHAEALETSARLRASSGDAGSAIEAIDRLADAEEDPQKRADQWVKSGKMLEEAGDKDRAIERYKAALDASPSHADAVASLRAIYASRGDAHGVAELLRRELDVTEGPIRRAELLAELGQLRRDRLDDPEGAVDVLEQALELDPTCTVASHGLGDMAFELEEWETAVHHYEPMMSRSGELDEGTLTRIAMRCAEAFRKLGRMQRAQNALETARAYAPDDPEVLGRLAETALEADAPDRAAELYGELWDRFGDQMVGGEKGRILYRRGEALRRCGQENEALFLLNDAAELIPEDAGPLESIREVYEQRGDWEEVVDTLKRRLAHADTDERADLLVRIGDVLQNKIEDKRRAAHSYGRALEARPHDRLLLNKLMSVYSETQDWSRLVEVILRIAELVDKPDQLAKYYITAASILNEELARYEEAAHYYARALESDPSFAKAFEGLVRCLSATGNWESLCEAYRAQLERIHDRATPERRAALWDALGETLHKRLGRRGEAIEAYEEAQRLDPDNRGRMELLAQLYTEAPRRYFQKAVQTHAKLLERNAYRVESYQALRRVYTHVKRPDESWCACQTLHLLKAADAEEDAFFQKHRATTPAAARTFFDEEMWFNHVLHPEQDPLLTGIFSVILPAVVATRALPLSRYGVDSSQRRDPAQDPAAMAQTLHYAAAVAQIPLPEVYYLPDDPGGLSILFSNPPAVGLGRGALAGGPPQALAFVAARHLAYFRPGHYVRYLVPTGSGLRAWLLAAIRSVQPQFPVPSALQAQVDENRQALRTHIPGPQQEQLHSLVHKLLQAAPELDMKKWFAAVDLTADRVGFVLANDLQAATAVIQASPDDAAAVSRKQRLEELYRYSVSEGYLQLRHKLGIGIDD